MEPTAGPSSSDDLPTVRGCILHVHRGKTSVKKPRCDVSGFDEDTWKVVQAAAKKRREKPQFANSVYFDVVVNLPESPTEADGYHTVCYSNFTAQPSSGTNGRAADDRKSDTVQENVPHLRSNTRNDDDANPSSSVILPPTCIFCNMQRRKNNDGSFERLGNNEELPVTDKIRQAAEVLQDQAILSKVIGGDLVSKEAKYHHSCKSKYMLKAERVSKVRKQENENTTDNEPKKSIAVRNIHEYVEKFVIADKRAELLTSVYERYLDFCSSADESPMHKSSLMRNLTGKFGSNIKVHCRAGNKVGSIVYNAKIADDSVRVAYDYSASEEGLLNKAALLLRRQLLNAQKRDLPQNPTLNDVKDGDTIVPDSVKKFFTVLYTGNISHRCGKRVQRRVESSSQDALFIVQRGRVKTQKHVTLGMALKSVTGSKKLVQVMNRLGHSVNYNCLEELETATAEAIMERKKACPEGTLPRPPIGLAFDNFDELTQTLSGSNTLHDTMGILYQNIPEDGDDQFHVDVDHHITPADRPRDEIPTITTGGVRNASKKKRSLTAPDAPLGPYFGVPKMTIFRYRSTNVFNLPDVTTRARQLDLVWMMSHALETDALPMWVGFNAMFYKDRLPKQEIRYMPNLKEPITSLAVVRHTLEKTQKCAEECHQEYGVVTYDLNAAKPAMQIQATESPRFDNVFIMLGAFHIEMAFFKAIGKLVSESGGTDVLTETEVLAPGSLNGFITGKHFNRCKRIHPLLALALETLHFKSFLKTCDLEDELKCLTSTVKTEFSSGVDPVISTELFVKCAAQYEQFTKSTLSGAHGSTAQFWMMYVEYINTFHRLERAIRTNDIGLFIYTLTPIIDLFFATAHVNYCRWLTKFQLDLLNMDDTHPGLREILNKGAFSIRRTEHHFSRLPVDLTLEQTVNADAASRLTGITSFTNDYSARLRWMITKATRASFITLLQEMTGLINKEDVTPELSQRRIQRDSEDLRKIIRQIGDTNNPFDKNPVPETLYNISTGKGASEEIRKSLLEVPSTGHNRHKEFIESCEEDPLNFERPIKKEKLKSFENGCATNRRTSNNVIASLKGSRDLMGRLLVLATKKKLDIEHVLQYPLTPVPLSMATPDEAMAKTDKSALFAILENKVKDHNKPDATSAYIIDGQFLLHSMPPNLPQTYGGLARSILFQCFSNTKAKSIHIAFDDYPQPSIKDTERDRRGADNRTFVITGSEQRRVPRDLNDALKSRSFKSQLPQFLADEWQDSSYVEIIKQREVILDIPGECYRFKVDGGVVHRRPVDALRNNHEEADTKICLHALFEDKANDDIVVRASDTDIAVILLSHCSKFQSRLWMDVGTDSKNNRRFISLTAIYQELGPDLCTALPAFHSYTGSDYTSSFVRKGKVRPFKLLEKRPDYQNAFIAISRSTNVSAATKQSLLNFTANIYGAKKDTSLNCCRHQKFMQVYGPKGRGKNLLANLRGIDASGLPPCESEVIAHINRASFVANMWASADKCHIEQHPTEENGWELVDGHYKLIWFHGEQLPENLIPQEEELEEIQNEAEEDMVIASSDEEDSSDEDD